MKIWRIDHILEQYPSLPQKFMMRFSLYCVNDIKHLLKDKPYLKTIKAVELWLEDKISKEEMVKYVNEPYDYDFIKYRNDDVQHERHACCSVVHMIHAACEPNSNGYVFKYNVDYVTYYVSKALNIPRDKYRDKLLEMIEGLDDMEKLIYAK